MKHKFVHGLLATLVAATGCSAATDAPHGERSMSTAGALIDPCGKIGSLELVNAAAAPGSRTSGDFDGDGKVDILWRNAVTGDVSLWLMAGRP